MRKGQELFNFLQWLHVDKGYSTNQSSRMADPYYISDVDFDKLLAEYQTGAVLHPLEKKP